MDKRILDFVIQAKAKGYSDLDIIIYLQKKGITNASDYIEYYYKIKDIKDKPNYYNNLNDNYSYDHTLNNNTLNNLNRVLLNKDDQLNEINVKFKDFVNIRNINKLKTNLVIFLIVFVIILLFIIPLLIFHHSDSNFSDLNTDKQIDKEINDKGQTSDNGIIKDDKLINDIFIKQKDKKSSKNKFSSIDYLLISVNKTIQRESNPKVKDLLRTAFEIKDEKEIILDLINKSSKADDFVRKQTINYIKNICKQTQQKFNLPNDFYEFCYYKVFFINSTINQCSYLKSESPRRFCNLLANYLYKNTLTERDCSFLDIEYFFNNCVKVIKEYRIKNSVFK